MAIGSKDEHNFKTRVKNGVYTFPLLVSREKAILKLVQKVVGDVTLQKSQYLVQAYSRREISIRNI